MEIKNSGKRRKEIMFALLPRLMPLIVSFGFVLPGKPKHQIGNWSQLFYNTIMLCLQIHLFSLSTEIEIPAANKLRHWPLAYGHHITLYVNMVCLLREEITYSLTYLVFPYLADVPTIVFECTQLMCACFYNKWRDYGLLRIYYQPQLLGTCGCDSKNS